MVGRGEMVSAVVHSCGCKAPTGAGTAGPFSNGPALWAAASTVPSPSRGGLGWGAPSQPPPAWGRGCWSGSERWFPQPFPRAVANRTCGCWDGRSVFEWNGVVGRGANGSLPGPGRARVGWGASPSLGRSRWSGTERWLPQPFTRAVANRTYGRWDDRSVFEWNGVVGRDVNGSLPEPGRARVGSRTPTRPPPVWRRDCWSGVGRWFPQPFTRGVANRTCGC